MIKRQRWKSCVSSHWLENAQFWSKWEGLSNFDRTFDFIMFSWMKKMNLNHERKNRVRINSLFCQILVIKFDDGVDDFVLDVMTLPWSYCTPLHSRLHPTPHFTPLQTVFHSTVYSTLYSTPDCIPDLRSRLSSILYSTPLHTLLQTVFHSTQNYIYQKFSLSLSSVWYSTQHIRESYNYW